MSARRLPKEGGCFLQAESEVAAINMVYGAAGAGAQGDDLFLQPGDQPKAGRHQLYRRRGTPLRDRQHGSRRPGPGFYPAFPKRLLSKARAAAVTATTAWCVLAPSSVQEAVELTQLAFDIADRYRNPVLVMGDGLIGQMMEPVQMPDYAPAKDLAEKTWAAGSKHNGERAIINSLYIDPAMLEKHNLRLQKKYDLMAQNEVRVQTELVEDADYVLVAYGTTARVARSAMRKARAEGLKVGLIRPITVWPFPDEAIAAAAKHAKAFLAVEMSLGQMVEDVRLAVNGAKPVHFFGRTGGMVPSVREVYEELKKISGEGK